MTPTDNIARAASSGRDFSPRGAWLGLAAGAACCVVFAIFGTLNVWPPMDGDAPAYFAAAVELSRGNAFENTVWLPPLDDSIDGPGGRRFIYHGFLHPLVVGTFGKVTGADAVGCVAAAYAVLWLAAVAAGSAVVASWRGAVRAGIVS